MKIAINGFGRIGRAACKIIFDRHPEMKIAAINDLADAKTLAHLLRHDSVYGRYEKEVSVQGDDLLVGGKPIRIFAEKDPAKLPWGELGIDVVLEATGFFTDRPSLSKHLEAGAKKVVVATSLSARENVPTFVPGVNEKKYDPAAAIVSCASCTTNCVVPLIHLLHKNFGVEKCLISTVHSYTTEQRLLDSPHADLRRGRSAAVSIVPASTHASAAVEEIIPELKGRTEASAFRVPTPIVSIAEVTAVLAKNASKEDLNAIFSQAAEKELRGIVGVSAEPLVSVDYVKNPHSAVVDLELTKALGNLAKVTAWYDNEWGHASRYAELAELVGNSIGNQR